jgi:hypothetical protein
MSITGHPAMHTTKKNRRKGAMVLELAIVLFTFLVLTMGTLEFGVAVFRYHIISNASRYAARRAIVHGELASGLGTWGTSAIDVFADATSEPIIDGAQDGISDMLTSCDLSETRVQVEWIDGSNGFEDAVRVTISTPYQPVLLGLFPHAAITLRASSTMPIAH